MPLYQLARVVLGELMKEPYVLDGALVASDEVATVDVRRIEAAQAGEVLRKLLRARGYTMEREAGITVVKREERRKEPERLFVYRPKFRSVSYLQGAARSFVPKGRFAGGGGSVPSPAIPAAGNATGPAPASATYTQSAVTSVVPAQGPVLASNDVLVFEGPDEEISKLETLVSEFDVPAKEILVKAYVFEVGASASEGSAVSLAVSLLGGRFIASSPAAALPNMAAVHVAGIDAAYSALQSDSRFRVVSAPTLRIRSGEHGKLSVGSEVPVLGAVSVSSTGQPVQSVEYRSSGVILDLRVEALEDVVAMVLQQQVSTFVATTTGVNASPTLLKRELSTSLSLRNGEVVVLGGLEEERGSDSRSGAPGILSFLSSRGNDRSSSKLVLLLEATVGER